MDEKSFYPWIWHSYDLSWQALVVKKTALFGLRDDFSTNSMINALFFSFWEHYVVYTNAAHCMSRYFLHKLNIGMPGYSRNLLAIFFHNSFFVMKNSYRNSIVISELWSNQVRCSKFVFVWSKLKVSAIEFLKFGNFDPTLSSNCQRSEWTSKKVPLVYFKNDKSIIFLK